MRSQESTYLFSPVYLAINKNASESAKKESLDFLYWLFSSETGKDYVTNKLDFITPFKSFTDDDLPTDPLAREVVRYMNDDTRETVPWIFTSFPVWSPALPPFAFPRSSMLALASLVFAMSAAPLHVFG